MFVYKHMLHVLHVRVYCFDSLCVGRRIVCVYVRMPINLQFKHLVLLYMFVCQGALRHVDATLGQEMLEVIGWLRDIQARDGDPDCRENARKLLTIM